MLAACARLGASRAAARTARAFSAAAAPVAGTLYMCGTGESHKLGLGDTRDRETPTLVEGLADVPIVHVACGKYHAAALSAAGDVYAWGLEASGQLGLGAAKPKAPTPQRVEALSGVGVTQLSCGMYHTLALTAEGEVYSCGFGGSFWSGAGGLGHGDRKQLEAPTKLAAFGADSETGVRAASVSAGGYHSVVRDVEGGVWTFGRGEWGRLGHGDASDCLEPTKVEAHSALRYAFEGVQSAQAGEGHTGVLGADGVAYTWGRNEHWQLGYEVAGLLNSGQSFDAQQEPQAVTLGGDEPLDDAKGRLFACGEMGSALLLESGEVHVWGMQRFFQPTVVPGSAALGPSVVDMQLGATHLVLLTDDGAVHSFGSGTALGLAKAQRKPWELGEITAHSLEGRKVASIACGSYSTALIVP
jgi:alpha-tubulin suppressor-like RCC1 family protein